MSYEPYATAGYYFNQYEGNSIPDEKLKKALTQASRHIDSLTYNRIVGRGFLHLTPFQQDVIREVVWASNIVCSSIIRLGSLTVIIFILTMKDIFSRRSPTTAMRASL